MDYRIRHHIDKDLAGSRERGTGAAFQGAHFRSAPAMEAESHGYGIVFALVRLFKSAGLDARGHRYQLCALAHPAVRREETGATERDRAYPVADTVQEDQTPQSEAAQALIQREV